MNYTHANGFVYTQQEVEEAAKKRNMSLEDYLSQTPELSIEGKTSGLPGDPTPSQNDMGSKSVSGGSEQSDVNLYDTDWGDSLKNWWRGSSARAAVKSMNPFKSHIQAVTEVAIDDAMFKLKDRERRNSEDWKLQANDFNNNMDKAFENPKLFQEILGDEETLQNRMLEAGAHGTAEEYLRDHIKETISGFSVLDDRKVDPTTGKPVYSKLTNSDMLALMEEKFNAKLYEEQLNVNNQYQVNRKKDILNSGTSLEDYWSQDSQTVMSEFTGNDKALAALYKEIMSGNLSEVDRIKKVKQFKELRAKDDKKHMVLDPLTGMLRIASDDKHRDKLLDEGYTTLPIGEKQKEYENITDYDVLKQEYQRSTLALGGLNDELNERITFNTEGYDYTDDYMSGSMTFREYINSPARTLLAANSKDVKGYTKDELEQKIARLKDDMVDYNADHEALKRMYFLNEGIKDQDIGAAGHLATSAKSLLEPFIGEYYTDRLMGGQTDRVILDKVGEKYDQLGFEKTPEDEKYLERNVGEMINEGFFGSGKILAEFYGVNKFLAPVKTITGFANYMKGLQSGKWVKNGTTYSKAAIKARAAKRGMNVDDYIKSLGDRVVKGKKGFEGARFIKGGTNMQKTWHTILTGAEEGVKFEAITAFDTGRFGDGFFTGFGFGVGGRMIAPLAPFMQKKGLLKDFDRAGLNVNTRKLFETFVTQPAAFVAGSEFGETMNAVVEGALGNKDFSKYMEEHYGDYGEIGKRLLTNHVIGLGFGQINKNGALFKGFADFKSKAGWQKARRTAYNKLKESATLAGVDKKMIDRAGRDGIWSEEIQNKIHEGLSDKNLAEYYKNWEVYSAADGRLKGLYRAEGYMDPSRADEMVKNDMKDYIKQQKDLSVDVRVEVVNNKKLRFGQKALVNEEGAPIKADVVEMPGTGGKVKLFRFNAEYYTPDVKAHEISHDYFESSFGSNAIFKGEFMNRLGGIADKMLLERDVTESEARKLYGKESFGDKWSGHEHRVGKQMTLHEAIKLKYPTFNLKDAVQNQRIQQWELFSHIAENIGNANHYNAVKGSHGYLNLRNLISDFGKRGGQKYDLSQEKDVVRWFRDYSKNIKKGVNQQKMFDKLESVIDLEKTAIEAAEMKAMGKTGPDTYRSEPLDLGGGYKINNPKEMAASRQKDYQKAMTEGKSKKQLLREMSDVNPTIIKDGKRVTNPNYDPNYPVLGKKLGPMLDMALSSWNKKQYEGGDLRIELADRSWEGKRAGIAADFLSNKSRGLENMFEKYEPVDNRKTIKNKEGVEVENPNYGKSQKLTTWVVGRLRDRMQETVEGGVGKMTSARETKAGTSGELAEFERIFEDVDAAGGKVDKGPDAQNPNIERKGIYLPEHKFNFPDGSKRTMDPASVENMKNTSKKVFYESKLEENTGVQIGEKLQPVTEAAMNKMIGVKKGMKPAKINDVQSAFFNRNKPMSYDAGIELTSNPEFYENTNAARGIFKFAHKNTGVKYKTAELTVEEARRTNARAYKYEKLKATPERIDKVQEVINSGRDAGTKVAKQNVLKNTIGKHFGNQIYREALKEIKQEIDSNLKDPASNTKYWLKQKAKLEGVTAELAMRRLRGAVPERLRSEDLNQTIKEFIQDVKSIDYAKELFPGFQVRNLVENNKKYKDLLEATGGTESFFKDMGYELKGVNLKTFQNYYEAQRKLGTNKESKPFVPELGYKNWGHSKFTEAIETLVPKNIRRELNLSEKAWYKNPQSVKEFDTFIKELYSTMPTELINHPAMRKAIGIGMGKQKLNDVYRGKDWAEKWYSENVGSGKAPKWLKHVRAVSNGPLKKNINTALTLPKFADVKNNPRTQKEFADYITKKYLAKKGSTYEQTLEANQKMHNLVYEKLFDYFKGSNNKALALNNIRRLLQMQTNIEGGFAKGLATHDAISLNKGAKHSEHDFQLFNLNANFMMNMLKNSGNKAKFSENQKALSKIFKQSIIDKSIQKKYDSKEFGGATSYDFMFTSESGKFPWMRDLITAETTLDLRSGKTYNRLLPDVIGGANAIKALEARNNKLFKQRGLRSEDLSAGEKIAEAKMVDKAIANGRMKKKKARGMSAFDFDETLIDKGENFIIAREPNTGKKVKISSGNWPIEGPKFAEQGYTFDFKDFVKVRGGVEGPLFKKFQERIAKFGPENMYILTARPPEAATAIYGWLKSKGVEIPFENITGLGNSTGEAKARWMLKKFSEGYNDMYFVDDAMPNVKAVKDVLSQLDIKSKVQQALRSEDLNAGVNNIMEHSLNIDAGKVFSKAEAKVRGKDIKRRRFLMTDSAADLELLIEPLYGKGKKGIKNKEWFDREFIDPFEQGIRDYNTARQTAKNDYMGLRKQNKDIVKKLSKEVEGTNFTHDQAMRVYLWNRAGFKIPDLAKTTETKLVDYIEANPKLKAYAEQFARITKVESGLKEPSAEWWGETIAGEVSNVGRGVSRKQYLQDWVDRKNEIFSEENLNKMESKLGTRWRENIVDMFDRMETGRTRSITTDRGSMAMMNYLNGSVGTIMNFNTRSAALQTISTVNFLNMRENNPIAAARAMGNTKQFAKDFLEIMNSDMLKQRRDGLEINVTEAELASAAATSKNPINAMIAKVLKVGYLPTKLADSFAISFGGATYYRNRAKMYQREGMSLKEAEAKAFNDFQKLSERTQQSSRPDLLSKQQTSLAGRLILPFANTPMQMNRRGIKDILDISKGRYKNNAEVAEKVGRITYYMGAQVALFAGLQSALFAMLLNNDDVSDEKIAKTKSYTLNTIADSFLRGMGIQGAIASGFKNSITEYLKQSEKGFNADYSEVAEALLNISPPIGSKFGKLDAAGNNMKWAKVRGDTEFKFELGNPSLEAATLTTEALTNIPLNRVYKKTSNILHSLNSDYENWQRALMLGGWTPWNVGVESDSKKKKKGKKKTYSPIIYN
mgnify:CR=1 FL=1